MYITAYTDSGAAASGPCILLGRLSNEIDNYWRLQNKSNHQNYLISVVGYFFSFVITFVSGIISFKRLAKRKYI